MNSIADLDELAICNTVPHQEMNGSETDRLVAYGVVIYIYQKLFFQILTMLLK